MSYIENESGNEIDLIRSYRAEEFRRMAPWVMIVVATPVIWLSGITDYKLWGWETFWLMTRGLYLPFAIACFMAGKTYLKNYYQLPILACSLYVSVFVSIFITMSGHENSPYIHGMTKLLLALSVMPFSWFGYLFIAIITTLIPLILCVFHYGSITFYPNSQISFLMSYNALGILAYIATSRLRNRLFETKAALEIQRRSQAHLIAAQASQLTKAQVAISIARTTQALAHDVRKPFTMFKMIIDAVDGAKSTEDAKKLLRESLPEVQQAILSVNGMISDVLEVGSESAPITEPTNPETLIELTLNEIFRVYPNSHVKINYELQHKYKVKVDTLKVSRVFSNIVGNALQAMNFNGHLWFKTELLEKSNNSYIKFCIGNSGSFIPSESLPRLFDAFFTSGKKGGTGLGLAIAQKIVTSHGGQIWCESAQENGGKVEVCFTLPSDQNYSTPRTSPLPSSSSAIVEMFENFRNSIPILDENSLDANLEKEIIYAAKEKKEILKVLIVDDEGVYRNSLAAIIQQLDNLKPVVQILFASHSFDALKISSDTAVDLVILDIDLGESSKSGYELLKELRSNGYSGVACVHSNRNSPDDYKRAIDLGADAVLPKPMSRTHFLKFLLQAALKKSFTVSDKETDIKPLREFAYLDDSKIFLLSWKHKMGSDAVVHTFLSPSEFRKHALENEGFLDRLDFILTDYYFTEGSYETGVTFAQDLRQHFNKPILLCSDGEFSEGSPDSSIDGIIPKTPTSWRDLMAEIKKFDEKS